MKKVTHNPIVQKVIEKFTSIQHVSEIFVKGNSAQRGLLISGDAGTGKSHFVKQAFIKTKTTKKVDYNKSASFTAPALYAKLFENRRKGDVIVFDDCSLESLSSADWRKWTDFLKGGLELSKGPKMIGYEAASKNPLFKEKGIGDKFDFQGSIIWITNTKFDKLKSKFGDHWDAINRRFISMEVVLTKEEKFLYTMHLIENFDILGKHCEAKEGGYSLKIIKDTINFLNTNYSSIKEITPGIAIKVADTMCEYPKMWKQILNNTNLYEE